MKEYNCPDCMHQNLDTCEGCHRQENKETHDKVMYYPSPEYEKFWEDKDNSIVIKHPDSATFGSISWTVQNPSVSYRWCKFAQCYCENATEYGYCISTVCMKEVWYSDNTIGAWSLKQNSAGNYTKSTITCKSGVMK